jgi:hypothetical protein
MRRYVDIDAPLPRIFPLTTTQRNPNQKKNNINYHLSRMYPKIVGPHKRN